MQNIQTVRVFGIGLLLFTPFQSTVAQRVAAQVGPVTSACAEAIVDLVGYRTPGAPFLASWKKTVANRRADGTSFDIVDEGKFAQDSAGRSYLEFQSISGSADRPVAASFRIDDFGKRLAFDWRADSNAMLASRDPDPSTPEFKKRMNFPWAKVWSVSVCVAWSSEGQYEGGDYRVEQLGTKRIHGIEATGILATRVYPAGTVTEERWFSEDLRIPMLSIVDDPRAGKSIFEVTEIERSEPDPSLFQPPPGYIVQGP